MGFFVRLKLDLLLDLFERFSLFRSPIGFPHSKHKAAFQTSLFVFCAFVLCIFYLYFLADSYFLLLMVDET